MERQDLKLGLFQEDLENMEAQKVLQKVLQGRKLYLSLNNYKGEIMRKIGEDLDAFLGDKNG